MTYHQTVVYKKAVCNTKSESSELQASLLYATNKSQISIQHRQRQKFRLTHDALYSLHELAFDTVVL